MINWKVRFKNKTFLITFLIAFIGFVYNVLGMVGIVPSVGQGMVENILINIVDLLVMLGIVVDPTTKGVSDCSTVLNQETKESDTAVKNTKQ